MHIGLDLNFLFYLMAVCTSGAVFPIGLLMCWTKLNKAGAIFGVIGGLVMGMVGWHVTAVTTLGSITTTTLTDSKVILAGSLSALGTGAIVSIGLSLIKPASFDFELTRAIGRGVTVLELATSSSEKVPQQSQGGIVEPKDSAYEPALGRVEGGGRTDEADAQYAEEIVQLEASQNRFRIITGLFLLVIRKLREHSHCQPIPNRSTQSCSSLLRSLGLRLFTPEASSSSNVSQQQHLCSLACSSLPL